MKLPIATLIEEIMPLLVEENKLQCPDESLSEKAFEIWYHQESNSRNITNLFQID